MKLFDNSQGYTTFTDQGTKKVVKFQNIVIDLIKELKNEKVSEEDIDYLLKMFLNDYSMEKLKKEALK